MCVSTPGMHLPVGGPLPRCVRGCWKRKTSFPGPPTHFHVHDQYVTPRALSGIVKNADLELVGLEELQARHHDAGCHGIIHCFRLPRCELAGFSVLEVIPHNSAIPGGAGWGLAKGGAGNLFFIIGEAQKRNTELLKSSTFASDEQFLQLQITHTNTLMKWKKLVASFGAVKEFQGAKVQFINMQWSFSSQKSRWQWRNSVMQMTWFF